MAKVSFGLPAKDQDRDIVPRDQARRELPSVNEEDERLILRPSFTA